MNKDIGASMLHQNLLSGECGTTDDLQIHEGVFTAILDSVAKETMDSIAQSHLIVGAGGSGKTHLLRRIESGIKKLEELVLQPIFIEGRTLFSTDDLWHQCAEQLQIDDTKSAYDTIIDWQRGHSCRIILLVDNIQYYFERTGNTEHYGLRGKLNKAGAPIVVATSDKMLPAFASYDAAFFEGFRISYLKPLSPLETESLINGKIDVKRFDKLMEYLPNTPRSVLTAVDIIKKSADYQMDLVFLTDYFSAYYQYKYDAYPAQIQKILSALSQTDGGATLREIRDRTKQDNGRLSPYLKMMVDKKIVEKSAPTPRSGIYKISDPLFKLWLRMNDNVRYEGRDEADK